jgi:outer membrane protein assembly factor BamB
MDYRSPRRAAPLLIVSNKVSALDRDTGAKLWEYNLGTSALRFVADEQVLVVLDRYGNLHRLDLVRGQCTGLVKTGLREASTFLFDGERFYVSNDTTVVALDSNGQELWRQEVGPNGGWGLVGMAVPPGIAVQPDFSRS